MQKDRLEDPGSCVEEVIETAGWFVRLRTRPNTSETPLLLLHGWTGDENSLWQVTEHMPDSKPVLSPRAPYIEAQGGYAWRQIKSGSWGFPTVAELLPAAEALTQLLDQLNATYLWPEQGIDVVGYSQGAVLTLLLALTHPKRIRKMALISGFPPQGSAPLFEQSTLKGLSVYIAHGIHDEQIPIARAQKMAMLLEKAQAHVVFEALTCGHGLKFSLLKPLMTFLLQG